MKVILTGHTPEPEKVIIEAAANCWKSVPREGILDHIIKAGHWTPLEFATFNFEIHGVSRALTHQLVRKRVGVAFAQESQRYVKYKDGFDYVTPPSIRGNTQAKWAFDGCMEKLAKVYAELLELVPAEDARFVLPNACTSSICMTINYHALVDLAKERLCGRAQWEIRWLVEQMVMQVWKVSPKLSEYLQPKCYWLKHCPEGKPCKNYAADETV